MKSKSWNEITPSQKVWVTMLGVAQLTLAGVAWADLARRPDHEVNGSKRLWAVVIGVNFIGPLIYLRFGRRR